jgi:hypothetical protein
MGTHQHTDDEHSHKAGQTHPAKQGIGHKAGKNYESEAEGQEGLPGDQ